MGVKRLLRGAICVAAVILLSSCSGVKPWQLPSAFDKGTVCAKWPVDSISDPGFGKTLKELKKRSDIEYVQIDVTGYQLSVNSPEIVLLPLGFSDRGGEKQFDQALRVSEKKLKDSVRRVHGLGLKVLLVPKLKVVDNEDGLYGRGDIGFTTEEEWSRWFDEYRDFILYYAGKARKYRVEMFSVGDGLSFTQERSDKWKNIIESVRRKYRGELVYAAGLETYDMIDSWENIDYIGINMNYVIAEEKAPDLHAIKAGLWKWSDSVGSWRPGTGRPVIFKEIGPRAAVEAE
ncbi:MAG: hypothetical protein GF408_07655 [Candidatus Omnitrophica bacterium]|nr:hypothetical protein [Candidatus Omnitrophota bacterium]